MGAESAPAASVLPFLGADAAAGLQGAKGLEVLAPTFQTQPCGLFFVGFEG